MSPNIQGLATDLTSHQGAGKDGVERLDDVRTGGNLGDLLRTRAVRRGHQPGEGGRVDRVGDVDDRLAREPVAILLKHRCRGAVREGEDNDVAAKDLQLQRDAGLTHFEYQVLAGLSQAPNRTLRMSTLAMFANGSLSRLSHVVNRLGNKGWIHRQPCQQDGRYTNAMLTDEGYDKVVATAPGHVDEVRRLVIDQLTKAQLKQLSAIGGRVLEAVASDAPCL